ncbi:hypothetical protein [Streptomyces hirsutus]|uniref:hypothetical protein n=1 Tax=Streptomyces hirsutus TaxID=35620 RepID=UPI00364663B3
MTKPTSTSSPAPTAEEIEAATRILMRAWHPGLLLPGDPGYAEARAEEEEYASEDGCQCAGTDDYGNSRGCNCGDGCSCDSCTYHAYSRNKICQAGNVSVGTRCTRETTVRVVAYRMQHNFLSARRADGVACQCTSPDPCSCTTESVFIKTGLQPVTYWTRTACSIPCAQQIIAAEMEHRDPRSELQYYMERWTYEPHDQDLPEALASLRTSLRMAHDRVGYLADALYQGRDASLDLRLREVHESVASAAWTAAQPLTTRGSEDDVWDDEVTGPVQEEPADPDDLE